jgi:hypothetical protein
MAAVAAITSSTIVTILITELLIQNSLFAEMTVHCMRGLPCYSTKFWHLP